MFSLCRPWPCLYCIPTSCDPSAMASVLVCVLLHHDYLIRNRQSGQLQPSLCLTKFVLLCYISFPLTCLSFPLQFVGLESIMTSLTDIYPSQIQRGCRRELLLMLICAFSYVFGLLMVSEVSCKKCIHSIRIQSGATEFAV